jgi:ankyrin repeat protein
MQHAELYKAVKHGDAINVRRLLSVGCDPNASWGGLDTPLSVAAARGYTPILRLLLDAGAKPTWYALQVAAFGNHAKAVRFLLAAGAPVDAGHGQTPLLNALKWSGLSREQLGRVRELLREAGGRELPDWYLRWRWSIRYGWRWRLYRLLYAFGWRPKQRPDSN